MKVPNKIAVPAVGAVAVAAVVGAWWGAPIRQATLEPATTVFVSESASVDAAPRSVTEVWSAPSDPLTLRPVVSGGLVISPQGHTLEAKDPATGAVVWTYTRTDVPLCTLMSAWDKVVAVYRSNLGCGDVVAINAASGEYSDTRSAIAPEEITPISSSDVVGFVADNRVELWRYDMVRTVEYGHVEARQVGEEQPGATCHFTSALSRGELLATVDLCEGTYWLRLQKTTPEDSRKPEIIAETQLGSSPAHVVAVSKESAAVYVAGHTPRVLSFDKNAVNISEFPAPTPAQLMTAQADLPHNMSWFDGSRLYLFDPTKLKVTHVIEGVLGTGVATGTELLVPTNEGYLQVFPGTGSKGRTIPIDRGGYAGPVGLSRAGDTLLEQRGDTLVALRLEG